MPDIELVIGDTAYRATYTVERRQNGNTIIVNSTDFGSKTAQLSNKQEEKALARTILGELVKANTVRKS